MSDFGSYLPQFSRTRWGSGQGAQISDEEKKRKEKKNIMRVTGRG
jgi:hypothetical protein